MSVALETRPIEKKDTTVDSPGRRRLPILLRRSWFGLNQALRRRLAHLGLTPDQFTALRTLTESPGISQKELTALMSSDPNTVTSLVRRMEESGLIERRLNQTDRRARTLRLTRRGRRQFAAARKVAQGLQTEVLRVLPDKAREGFLRDLERLASACQQALESSPRAPGSR